MNINNLYDSILKQLRLSYDVKVYKCKVKQNLRLPCFFVDLDSSKFETSLHGRYSLNCKFKVSYLHDQDTSDLFLVAESLFKNLLFLSDCKLKAKNMNFIIKDNTLLFYLEFKVYLKDLNFYDTSSAPLISNLQERIGFNYEKY